MVSPASYLTPSTSVDGSLATSLANGLVQLQLQASAEQQAQLLAYISLIAQWNKVYNLTAVREPTDMLTHHILDSLAVIPPMLAKTGHRRPLTLLDVGAGAGLPGVVIAIMCPDIQVTSIDTVAKKAAFMTQVGALLKLPNFKAIHSRVESWPSIGFDIVTSRAFASLTDFVSWTKFHVKHSDSTPSNPSNTAGLWMALKGKTPTEEIAQLPPDVVVTGIESVTVPGLDAERCLVWMRFKDSI